MKTVRDGGSMLLRVFRASQHEQETLGAIGSNRKPQQNTPRPQTLGKLAVGDAGRKFKLELLLWRLVLLPLKLPLKLASINCRFCFDPETAFIDFGKGSSVRNEPGSATGHAVVFTRMCDWERQCFQRGIHQRPARVCFVIAWNMT